MESAERQDTGVQVILGQMKDRLRRGEIVRLVSTGLRPSSVERLLLDDLPNKPTSLARSEQLVNPNNLTLLNRKIDAIREWLFLNGRDFTTCPDYQDWLDDGNRTREELERCFWHETDSFTCNADKTPLASQDIDKGWKLSLIAQEEKAEIDIDFGFDNFDNRFELAIRFRISEPSQELAEKILRGELTDEEEEKFYTSREAPTALDYRSSRLPLDQMTQEEYKVMTHYLDAYARTVGATRAQEGG